MMSGIDYIYIQDIEDSRDKGSLWRMEERTFALLYVAAITDMDFKLHVLLNAITKTFIIAGFKITISKQKVSPVALMQISII
jgi:hypothetical protein